MPLELIALAAVGLVISHATAALLGSSITDFLRHRRHRRSISIEMGGVKLDLKHVKHIKEIFGKAVELNRTIFGGNVAAADAVGGDTTGAPTPTLQARKIDANLVAQRFEPGASAVMTITIRLPANPAKGKWQGEALVQSGGGPVDVILETQGFTLVSERPQPVEVPDDRDSAPVAFELRIEEENPRWIHVLLVQNGSPMGELTINDFSLLSTDSAQHKVSTNFRRTAEADLTLVIRAAEGRIEVSSPRDRACLDHVTIAGFKYPEMPFRKLLASRLKDLYDSNSNPEDTAREMHLVGVDLATCLPADLIKLLRRDDVRSVMLRHEEDFDFPLELAFLDDRDDPFFVGERR